MKKLIWYFFAGFLGTALYTFILYYIGPLVFGRELDIAGLIGAHLGNNWTLGMITHFFVGSFLIPFVYYYCYPFLPGKSVINGIIYAIFIWLGLELVVMPILGGGLFSMNIGGTRPILIALIGHIFYGAILGAVAGLKKNI